MIAEILSTGNEVLSGVVVDTNAAFIAEKLEAAGIEVKRQTCVGDDLAEIAAALSEIARRSQIAVVTGGLGPTGDDLTSEAVARAAGLPLAHDPAAMETVKHFFDRRGIPMRETDPKQALLPRGAECLDNPVGSAPGFALTIDGCHVFVLPGVPHEMKTMLNDQVLPRLEHVDSGRRLFSATATVSVFGLPESEVGRLISGMADAFADVRYGIRVAFPQIYVALSSRKHSRPEAETAVAATRDRLIKTIGPTAFSDSGLSLEAEVARLLTAKRLTLALAESCTGGLVSDLMTNVSGSSAYFLSAVVTYANSAKTEILKVSPDTIETFGAVSEETARAMAIGVRRLAGADFGLSLSGIAGPDGGTAEKPVGTVCIGLAGPDAVMTTTRILSFQKRTMNKRVFAFAALEMLRRQLKEAVL